MFAVCITSPGDISLVELPTPKPASDEIRIALSHVGYCGSDLSSFKGSNPLVSYPRVPGHELSGTIDMLGATVPNAFSIGQRVTVLPYFNCGNCFACRNGKPNACIANQTMGVQREGAMAEFACVHHAHVLPVEDLEPHELALIEPLAISFHAVGRGVPRPQEWVAVLGVGMIGLGIQLAAIAAGARVVAIDLSVKKLDLAHALGATAVIDASQVDVIAALMAITGEDGASLVFEAAGSPITFRSAIDMVSQTARVVYVGYTATPVEYETRKFVTKEINILGSRGATRADFTAATEYLRNNRRVAKAIVSKTVPLAEAPTAMREWMADPSSITKIIVSINGD